MRWEDRINWDSPWGFLVFVLLLPLFVVLRVVIGIQLLAQSLWLAIFPPK